MPENTQAPQNGYDNLSSKIKRLYIPLPHYKFFHQPSSVEATDEHFVGRESIMAKLKSWLTWSKKNPTGSYLVTGYRGMGKSSFVGKTISDMIDEQRIRRSNIQLLKVAQYCCIISLFLIGIGISISVQTKSFDPSLFWIISILVFVATLIVFATLRLIKKVKKYKSRQRHIHYLSLNLGNEITSERDVLALIADSIRIKFKEYQAKYYPYTNWLVLLRSVGAIITPLIALGIYKLFDAVNTASGKHFFYENETFADRTVLFFNQLFVEIGKISPVVRGLFALALAFLFYHLITKLIRFILKKMGLKRYFVTAKEALSLLNRCCDRINSFVDEDSGPYSSVNTSFGGFVLKKKKIKRNQIASVLEIEQELIEITKLFKNSCLIRSHLIIVLDELDKIVIPVNNENKETKSELPEFSYDNGFPGSSSSRGKKQNVLYLLAKLKFFISNANAKFVFISGRELYDAYLADVSDREFSISSIFNGVINVDSFFSCNTQTKDITKLTEMYICKQLREKPKNADKTDPYTFYSLSEYYQDLTNTLDKHYVGKSGQALREKDRKMKEIEKVIVFLKQFITYLTFLSNGAPKKLTTHFEKRLITRKEYESEIEKSPTNYIGVFETINPKRADFYLSFGYYDQQRVGFLHYMAYPIFQTIISPSSEYGDKLLISATFLISHIYKHHSGGFSWRNLEYIPELIESNKTPELRDFINSMISYLGQIHLAQITTGLYHYKFPMKLYEEISVFSKKSEQVSAIFNFSRDDSRSVKQYFADMIEYHSKRPDESSPIVSANLHHYLGDQYLASEEYTEAINQFRTTKDLITKEFEARGGFAEDKNAPLIARLVLVMLKMGLAYEKRNTVDSAYLTYCEIVNLLISNRHIHEEKFHLEYRLEKQEDSWVGHKVLLFEEQNPFRLQSDSFHQKVHPKFISKEEEQRIHYWAYNDELVPNLAYHLSAEKSYLISKLSMYEDLRTVYLALLAKLFAIEKQNISGITLGNVAVTESEFRYLFLATNNKEKYLLSADFFRKLGDILYYKNSDFKLIPNNLVSLLDAWGYDMKIDIFDYCYNKKLGKNEAKELIKTLTELDVTQKQQLKDLKEFLEETANADRPTEAGERQRKEKISALLTAFEIPQAQSAQVEDFFLSGYFKIPRATLYRLSTIHDCLKRREEKQALSDNGYKRTAPCYACKYYNRSLSILAKKMLPAAQLKEDVSKAVSFLTAIKYDSNPLRENNLNHVALSLEAMGNVMLCCTETETKLRPEFLERLTRFYTVPDKKELFRELSTNQLEKAILYYCAAAEYYKKAANNRQATQCYVKIFNFMVSYIVGLTPEDIESNSSFGGFIRMLHDQMLTEAIRCAYSNRDFHNLTDMSALGKDHIQLGNTSIMPDIEEALLAYYKIHIELERKDFEIAEEDRKNMKTIYRSNSLNYLRLESLTYTRIMALLFKANLNSLLLERMLLRAGVDRKHFQALSGNAEDTYKTLFDQIKKGDDKFSRDLKEITAVLSDDQPENPGFEALEFLVTDSVFCLVNVIGFLTPTSRTTLFTNSFCSDVYKKLLEWNKIKKWLENYYREDEASAERFETYFNSKIEIQHRQELLRDTYLAEMAIKYHRKAIEMNSEGQTYQEFIRSVNLADDELQNDTCQFYLALERYKLNRGAYQERIKNIFEYAKDYPVTESRCYEGLNYFGGRQAGSVQQQRNSGEAGASPE